MDVCTCAGNEAAETLDVSPVLAVLEEHPRERGALIPVLQATQDALGYLPREALLEIARVLQIPLSSVYGVATFYSQFHLHPRGKTIVRICQGTACHVRGAPEVTRAITDELGVAVGETSDDLRFTVESVACVGCCGLAPVILVDNQTRGNMDAASGRSVAAALRKEHPA